MRRRWQGHHQVAALEALNPRLEDEVFGVGNVGCGIAGAGILRGPAVIAKPGLVVVADAGSDDQVVIIDMALGGDDAFPFTLGSRHRR